MKNRSTISTVAKDDYVMNDAQMKSISTTAETAGSDKQQTTKLAYRFMYDLVAKMVFSQNSDLF
jgi:hypothetical protein